MKRSNNIQQVAIEYAKRGWPVLPLHSVRSGKCTCGNARCGSPGKHPLGDLVPHGVKDASTDTKTIKTWFKEKPFANIGIGTGATSGLMVLDIDPRHGGDESLKRLTARFRNLPKTVKVRTGSGGRHYYFAYPSDARALRNSVRKLGPGLDIRAENGFVVAPPSKHVSGKLYKWINAPDEVRVAP